MLVLQKAIRVHIRKSYLRHGSRPLNFRGDLKISDQNNWGGGGMSKTLNLGWG